MLSGQMLSIVTFPLRLARPPKYSSSRNGSAELPVSTPYPSYSYDPPSPSNTRRPSRDDLRLPRTTSEKDSSTFTPISTRAASVSSQSSNEEEEVVGDGEPTGFHLAVLNTFTKHQNVAQPVILSVSRSISSPAVNQRNSRS